MNIRFFKHTRNLHKWIGLLAFIFILILSISGIFLMHGDALHLGEVEIDSRYLPDKYFHVDELDLRIQSLAAVDVDDRISIFAGASHGLFRSTDSGKTWEELREGLFNQDIRALAANAANPKIIYAGTAKGIFKSENGGNAWGDWFEETSGLSEVRISALAIHPENADIVYAATPGGLFATRDGGESWEHSFNGGAYEESRDVRAVRLSANNPNVVYIGTRKGAFQSVDAGKTWEGKWESVPPNINSLISLKTDPEFIYIGTAGGLYKSFNRGITWLKDKDKRFAEVRSLFIGHQTPATILLAAGSGLFASNNGGDSWKEITPKRKNAVAVNAIIGVSPSLYLAGANDGLFVSSNGGRDWTPIKPGRSQNAVSQQNFKMSLAKLMTEVHTGRFFGYYFYLLVDLATLGLIALAFSGLMIAYYRERLKKRGKAEEDAETGVDMAINVSETADNLSHESREIHDMIEHINNHLKKCKSTYDLSTEKKEIEEIGKHILTIDKKMHHLMSRLGEFAKIDKN